MTLLVSKQNIFDTSKLTTFLCTVRRILCIHILCLFHLTIKVRSVGLLFISKVCRQTILIITNLVVGLVHTSIWDYVSSDNIWLKFITFYYLQLWLRIPEGYLPIRKVFRTFHLLLSLGIAIAYYVMMLYLHRYGLRVYPCQKFLSEYFIIQSTQ